ncbi:MAG: ATP synthase F0 subunit B, partial [Planctomycetota bacterium]
MLNSCSQLAWRYLNLSGLLLGLLLTLTCSVTIAEEKVANPETATAASEAGQVADHAGGHGGGHHDENDLSHANATPELMSLQELRADLAIWTFVLFVLLFLALAKFAWGPIMKGLKSREDNMARLLAEAQTNAARSEAAIKEHETKLAAANEEARTIL